jgi:hypothetical protein
MIVGIIETLATNHVCWSSSRHANGLRGISISVSSIIENNSPIARSGLVLGRNGNQLLVASSMARRLHRRARQSVVCVAFDGALPSPVCSLV